MNPGANPVDHHDYVELSNGGRAMVTYPLKTGVNMSAMVDPAYTNNEWMVDGVIQEINAAGQLVWSWAADDHFGYGEVTFPQRFQQYLGAPNGGEVDPWHINSIDRVTDGSGDYVVSMRHLDADRPCRPRHRRRRLDPRQPARRTRRRSRGHRASPIVDDPLGGPRRPHDARLSGDVLTMLDNRTNTGQPARAVAYRIDTNAGTATLLWQISNPTGLSSPGPRQQPGEPRRHGDRQLGRRPAAHVPGVHRRRPAAADDQPDRWRVVPAREGADRHVLGGRAAG